MADVCLAVTGRHPDFPASELYGGSQLRRVLATFAGPRQVARHMCPGPCRQQRWGVWLLVIRSNGVRIANLRCTACGWKMADKGAAKFDVDLPLEQDNHDPAPCERCGSTTGTELHHWAPRHLFDDADAWPMSYLCPACHREWHQIVTPHMHRKKAST